MKKKRPEKKRHGHPRFYEIQEELAKLHSDKNYDYAAGGDPLGNFERRAAIYAMYPGLDLSDPAVVALLDATKQMEAVLWMYSNGHKAKVEGKRSRMKDVAVLSVIDMILEEEK